MITSTSSNPHVVHAEAMPAQPWRNGGGQTRELLAWPSSASSTNWQLRISRADIAVSGPFSAFPGVQRWFVVLSGQGVLLHMPTPDHHTLDHLLEPGHTPLHFDGALAPGCTLVNGPTQDLNLMARGGQACLVPVDADQAWQADYAQCGLYTACSGTWHCGGQTLALVAHSLLWLEHAPHAPMRFVATPLLQPLPLTSPDPTLPSPRGSAPDAATDAGLDRAWWWGFTPENTACPTN